MSFVCSEIENMSISINYYEFIKQMYENVTKYIKKYREETSEYYKKLLKIQEKYDSRLKGIEQLKKINNIKTKHILSLSSNICSVINTQITNLQIFLKEVDEVIKSFDKTLKEKNKMSSGYLNEYDEYKNNLQKKYKDTEKAKNIFFEDAFNTENLIYNFNAQKGSVKKEADTQMITKSQVDSSIKIAKKHENEYNNSFNSTKNFEDKFFELTDNSIDNMKRISCEIMTKMKDNIVKFLLFLKNCFKLPLSEIDIFLPELVSLDENKKIEEIINSTYKKDNNLIRVQLEKYDIKIVQNVKDENANEDDATYIIEDEEIIYTVKTMENNFNLINKGTIEEINSPEKLRCRYLTYKLLSFSPKIIDIIKQLENNKKVNKSKDKEDNYSITDDEVKELFNLLQKVENRMIFLKKFNNFRRYGKLEIPKREFHIICDIFNDIAKYIKGDKILDGQLAIIILSETYYKMENGNKIYILNYVKDNKIFKEKDFWYDFLNKSILKEVQRNFQNDLKNNKEDIRSENKNLEKLVFAQILPIIKTMTEFELDGKIFNEILEDIVSYYKIDNNSRKIIFDMVNFKGTEKQKEIKDKCEKFLELSCVMEDENEYKESVFETINTINNLKLKKQNAEKNEEESKEKEEDNNNKIIKEIKSDEFDEINKQMIKDDVEDDEEEEEIEKQNNNK